jgi:hypothetical protein
MRFRAAWYALVVIALVLILFELFFRFRYVHAGDRVWRIDRLTERACLVTIGDAVCSGATAPSAAPPPAPTSNPLLKPPTPPP